MYFETKNPRLVPFDGLLWDQSRIDLEEDVLERRPEVRTIDVGMARGFGIVEVFAFAAVELDGLDVREICHACRKKRVRAAHDSGAFTKVAFFVFLKL